MKKIKITLEELNMLMDLVEERHEMIMNDIYDIINSDQIVPDYLEQDCNRYRDIWNRLLLLKCKKQKKKLYTKKESDLTF